MMANEIRIGRFYGASVELLWHVNMFINRNVNMLTFNQCFERNTGMIFKMSSECPACKRRFASGDKMKRHMIRAHPEEEDDDETLSDITEDTEPDKSDENMEVEEENEEEAEEEEEEEQEEDWENNVWRSLIEDALENLGHEQLQKHNIATAQDLLTEPGLSLLISKLCEETSSLVNNAEAITEGKLWQKIIDTTNELGERNYDDDDNVDEMAWMQRKYAVRKLLEDNLDVMYPFFTESESDEEKTSEGPYDLP